MRARSVLRELRFLVSSISRILAIMNISTFGNENSPTVNFSKDVVVLLIGYNRPEKITKRIFELSKMKEKNISSLV